MSLPLVSGNTYLMSLPLVSGNTYLTSLLLVSGNTYLTSLPLVSVHRHGHVNSVNVEIRGDMLPRVINVKFPMQYH